MAQRPIPAAKLKKMIVTLIEATEAEPGIEWEFVSLGSWDIDGKTTAGADVDVPVVPVGGVPVSAEAGWNRVLSSLRDGSYALRIKWSPEGLTVKEAE